MQAIASALETFYGNLIEKIDGLNIQKVMKRKKPIVIAASGGNKALAEGTDIMLQDNVTRV